jgi:two-component system sensor histidine kinase ChiS
LSQTLNSALRDREGNYWFAQVRGVSKLRADYRAFESLTSQSYTGEKPVLPAQAVNAVAVESGENPVIWVGTTGKSIVKIAPNRTSMTIGTAHGVLDDWVNAMRFDSNGRLWVASHSGINVILSNRNKPVSEMPIRQRINGEGEELLIAGRESATAYDVNILDIQTKSSGERLVESIWIPGYWTVYCYVDEEWFVLRQASGLPKQEFAEVVYTDEGRLLVVARDFSIYRSLKLLTVSSLNEFNTKPALVSTSKPDAGYMKEIDMPVFEEVWSGEQTAATEVNTAVWYDSCLWVCTNRGIFILGGEPFKILDSIQLNRELKTAQVTNLQVSSLTGTLWAGTNAGLVEIDPTTRSVKRIITRNDGLLANEAWQSASIAQDQEGTIYYGTPFGLALYRPHLDQDNLVPPAIRMKNISIKEDYRGNNEVSFEYAALSYTNERQVRYKTRLIGYDDWSSEHTEHKMRFTNLPAFAFPREYTFEVQACNNDDVWTETPSRYSFSVTPAWWFRWWGLLIEFLLLAGFVVGYVKYRTRKHVQAFERERQVSERLRQVDKLKDEFLANTSHELRTPLQGIIGITESLIDGVAGSLPEKAKANLAMVSASGKRLASLVNDILDFSKLKKHDLKLQKKPVDVRVLTDFVLRVSEQLALNKPVELKNQISTAIPVVDGDENRLQQILLNLVGNAIKFTEAGTVTISAMEKDGMVEFSVRDTGIGITEDKLETVFESFEQADASTERLYGGTGLGLAVTRQLVELHGGKIWVESEVGEGSTFTFSIPVGSGEADNTLQAPALSSVSGAEEMELPGSMNEGIKAEGDGRVHVLVVDDEPINQQVLANHLEFINCTVVQAMNGEEALRALRSDQKFDLVLLDIMMPKMSGYEVCQKIRETHLPSELPVIMVTAKNQLEDLVEGLSSGANDYLAKPFNKGELIARMKTQLNLSKLNSAYGRFVPHEFLKFLEKESIIDVRLGDNVEMEMTIFVSDIRGFTTLSEKMTPEQNFKFINDYLEKVSPIVRTYDGFVDRYSGDAIMALFPGKPDDAIQAAIETLHTLAGLNSERRTNNELPINVGIGLHTGGLMLGIVGERERAQGDIFSDAVNLANRIEGLSKLYGVSIVVSEETLSKLNDNEKYHQRFLGKVQVKGKKESVSVFEIYDGDAESLIELKLKTKQDFEQGLEHYFDQNFTEASVCFNNVLKRNPDDKTASLYLGRSAKFMVEGVSPDWQGVEAFETK